MCGRYAFYLSPSELKRRLGLENLLNIPPRYNCGPMQDLPVVIKGRMGCARWGFRPAWSGEDDPAQAVKMINARSESVHEKPSYRDAWAQEKRCLVPVNGFYEWAKDAHTGVNQPYYIMPRDHDMLYLAGLWSKVREQVSFTILTKAADDNLAHLHHRSPVMIGEDVARDWFDADLRSVLEMIARSTTHDLAFHRVGLDVGKVSNDHAGLIEEASEAELLQQSGRLL